MTTQDDLIQVGAAKPADPQQLLGLYQHMNSDDPLLPVDEALAQHWRAILENEALYYTVARDGDRVVATCALTIVPNLTRSARPYGLIENVVTHPDYRKLGIGTRILHHALDIAWSRSCYKVMLLTSRKDEAVFRFYENAGFARGVKTGFVAKNPVSADVADG